MKMSRRKQARPSRHLDDDDDDQENALDLQINQVSNKGKFIIIIIINKLR